MLRIILMENGYEEGKKKVLKRQIFLEVIELLSENGGVTDEEKNRIKGKIDRGEV